MLLSVSGITIFFSSVYFLYFPVGFQGGRNPYYGAIIVFNIEMWDAIHLRSGIGMIIVLILHIAVHDKWIFAMIKRVLQGKFGRIKRLNKYAQFNILLDAVAALSFLVVSLSGFALMLLPSGRSVKVVDGFILSKTTWDIIHTWSGVVMLISVILHFYIHLKWITKVTKRVVRIKKNKIMAKEN